MNIQTSGRTTSDAGNGWASSGIAKESGGNLDAMAASLVTIANNTGGPETGVSTAAKQDIGNASLATIATNTTGAATSENQATEIGYLNTVATAQGAGATGITQPSGGSGILGWLSGIFNKLNTSIAVTGTFWQSIQPVSGTVSVSNFPTTANTVQAFALTAGQTANIPMAGNYGCAFEGTSSGTGTVSVQWSANGGASYTGETLVYDPSTGQAISSAAVSGTAKSWSVLVPGGADYIQVTYTGSGVYTGNLTATTAQLNGVDNLVSINGTPIVGASLPVSSALADNAVLDTQSSIVSAGVGAVYNTAGYGLISFELGGNWTGAVVIQGSNSGAFYDTTLVRGQSSDQTIDIITGPGIYLLSPNTKYVQYNVLQVQGSISLVVVGKVGQSTPSPLAFAQSVDPATGVQIQANIAGGIGKDALGNLIISDAPQQLNLFGEVGSVLIIDTLGYQSLQLTTQAMAGAVTYSSDKTTWSQWLMAGSSGGASTSFSPNSGYVFPCAARYIRIVINTAGTATGFLRNQPFVEGTNLFAINGTPAVTGGVNGMLGVGGNVAAGVAPTSNPVLTGGVDTGGLTRRFLTDPSGRVYVDAMGLGSDQVVRQLGQLPPSASFQNIPPLFTLLADLVEGQTMPDLWLQMLTEMRITNFYLSQLPQALNNSTTVLDEPSTLRNVPQDLL